jgi:PKD repeat protein
MLTRTASCIVKSFFIPLVLLVSTALIANGQINGTGDYELFISGQVTNIENGAPVPGQVIYIESDLQYNPSFAYSDSITTDALGFYYDTIQTNVVDGSLVFITYDTAQIKVQQYFRFQLSDTYNLAQDFQVYDPSTLNDFQASFLALKDTIYQNNLHFQFYDHSYGEDIVYWKWEFGDGNLSYDRNPRHTYEERGIYEVSLTVSNKHAGHDAKVSTIVQHVHAGFLDFYHLGGHVFAEGFPIDLGYVYLFKYEGDNQLAPIDTARIDTLGYYYFYQLAPGDYVTKSFLDPSSTHFKQYAPTYYGNTLTWDDASTIKLDNEDNWECDIRMLQPETMVNGDGLIQGTITFGGSDNPGNPPAENVEILLLDNDETCMNYLYSNGNGEYSFEELPYGNYIVHAEMPGKETIPAHITIDANNPALNNLDLIILSGQIIFDIEEISSDYVESIKSVYPNPARDMAFLELDISKPSYIRIDILNYAGQVVLSSNEYLSTGVQKVQLDTRTLARGMYAVVLTTQDNVQKVKKLVVN